MTIILGQVDNTEHIQVKTQCSAKDEAVQTILEMTANVERQKGHVVIVLNTV